MITIVITSIVIVYKIIYVCIPILILWRRIVCDHCSVKIPVSARKTRKFLKSKNREKQRFENLTWVAQGWQAVNRPKALKMWKRMYPRSYSIR